ncbi:helix-turn-helix transcriptional regulator [Leeuwenhoekiella aequorea]|jgi:transcriptional regulator with XRE-family HTH domain|uniref:helix-turn-helix domain-containing protein n=1 Tax=Flavobacteriaceae TaxID=49546 RepID=UPI0004799E6F|nr:MULTISPECIES: helix-turn-helix transcriptional regulator [Flavobacteriaceae]|tara:strand:+ start:724 stop:1011 length:288 start_codon:yes stop_codon:yes gene_type:complete
MNSKKAIVLPKYLKIFEQIGENVKLARKRRKLTTEQVSERAGIHRATLYRIEKGDPAVAIGLYFNVFRVLNLQDDFLKLAVDDEFGRKLQDLDLL